MSVEDALCWVSCSENVWSYQGVLIILVRRRVAEEESGEGKLEGGGVAIDHLAGDVQVVVVVLIVRVVQRTVRHKEEVLRGEVERVGRDGIDGVTRLLKLHGSRGRAIVPLTHTIYVYQLSIIHRATVTVFSVVTNLHL